MARPTHGMRMKNIDRAYEILHDPVFRAHDVQFYLGTHAAGSKSPFLRRRLNKKCPWAAWPEGTYFPRWRSAPPGAWPCDTMEIRPEPYVKNNPKTTQANEASRRRNSSKDNTARNHSGRRNSRTLTSQRPLSPGTQGPPEGFQEAEEHHEILQTPTVTG